MASSKICRPSPVRARSPSPRGLQETQEPSGFIHHVKRCLGSSTNPLHTSTGALFVELAILSSGGRRHVRRPESGHQPRGVNGLPHRRLSSGISRASDARLILHQPRGGIRVPSSRPSSSMYCTERRDTPRRCAAVATFTLRNTPRDSAVPLSRGTAEDPAPHSGRDS